MPKTSSFLQKQKLALGVGAVIVVGIVVALSTVVIRDAPLGEYVEGEHYVIVDNPRRVRGDRVEVMEFFSYACPHCYNFEPDLKDWVESNEEAVRFVRTPAVGNDYWLLLARNYYTMEELGILEDQHMAFFREIHDVKRQFTNPALLARHFDGKGTSESAYRDMWNSTAVAQKLSRADQMGRRLQVASVPSVVVHGKYMVKISRAVGPNRMLDVVDHLVAKVQAEKAGAAAPAETTTGE